MTSGDGPGSHGGTLHDLSRAHLKLLDEEIDRLQQTVGPARFRARFRSPNQRDLLR